MGFKGTSSAPTLRATVSGHETCGLSPKANSFVLGGGLQDGSFGLKVPPMPPHRCGTIVGFRPGMSGATFMPAASTPKSRGRTPSSSKAQDEELKQQFHMLDKDHSGTLELDELIAGAGSLGLNEDQARKHFKAAAATRPRSHHTRASSSAAGSLNSQDGTSPCLQRTLDERRQFEPMISLCQWVEHAKRFPIKFNR